MNRALLSVFGLLVLAPAAAAQDMPLSQILIDGEGWTKASGEPAKPNDRLLVRVGVEGGKQRMWAPVGGREITVAESTDPGGLTDAAPHAVALTPDGMSAYLGYPSRQAVWAFQVGQDGRLSAGAPYAPLRLARGQQYQEVTGLVIDRDGRIYAATPIGIQVFDPTGRLCGVLHPPAPGRPEFLAFEEDRLTVWVGVTKYVRKLKTTGAK